MLVSVLAGLASMAALGASERCFITNDWRDGVIVPGEPNVLIWEPGANRDILLSGAGPNGEFTGVVARNVSQGSVFWVPPRDIVESNPDGEYEFQLWDLTSQNGCSSPSFKFAEVEDSNADNTTDIPYGPFVTTAISIINTGWVTATATVATYASNQPMFDQQVTGSITATDSDVTSGTVTATSTSTSSPSPSKEDEDSGPNTIAIAVGTVGGILVVALIVVSILLWRAKKKKQAARTSRADSVAQIKDVSATSTPTSQMTELDHGQPPVAEVQGASARFEMPGDRSAWHELPTNDMEPVELPADMPPPPSYSGHEDFPVSPVTGGSRRSSMSFDKGTFTVSPISRRRDEKE